MSPKLIWRFFWTGIVLIAMSVLDTVLYTTQASVAALQASTDGATSTTGLIAAQQNPGIWIMWSGWVVIVGIWLSLLAKPKEGSKST